jgi:hypothetical protein
MLKHECTGPNEAGEYLITYLTPGCSTRTVAGVALTAAGADAEVTRLNDFQVARERALQADRLARGLGGTYPGLADELAHAQRIELAEGTESADE